MLKLLRISNIALIQAIELEFRDGLTLLTGETGAGKSILIDALGLLLGARASSDLVRTGSDLGVVEGAFESAEAGRVLEARGLPSDGDEVLIRREIQASGKGGKTLVNGSLAPVSLLRELAPSLAAIHGQHEPQGLLDPATHLPLVDRHAGLEEQAAELAALYRTLRESQAALRDLRRDSQELARRRDVIEFQLTEIEKARLLPGEDQELAREKAVQANAGRLAALSEEAYSLLYDDETSVATRLGQALRRLDELASIDDRFSPLLEGRREITARIEDMALFLRDYREGLQVAPGRLDEIESRLAVLDRLKKRYGPTLDQVSAFAESCRAELETISSPERREKELVQAQAQAEQAYLSVSRDLTVKRRSAARDLERKVEAELALLAMEATRFQVAFAGPEEGDVPPDRWTDRGLDEVEFLLAPNPGEEPRPLARIASGGELSRILLALKTVASLDAPGQTLVFDEVDAGIGGRVAEIVGRKLRSVSARHQVLCVTHLPQIASLADHHYQVRKRIDARRTVTDVRSLTEAERVEEIARMLGGETVSEAARRHAREMVKQSLRT